MPPAMRESLQRCLSRLTFHSRVAMLTNPYKSCVLTALGSMSRMMTFLRLVIFR